MIELNPIQTNSMPLKHKILNMIWLIINCTLFRFTLPTFKFFKLYRVLLTRMFGSKISWTCYLHPTCKIEYPWNLTMGHLSSLGSHSWAYALDKIIIGEKCCIGNDVYLLTGSHDISRNTFDLVLKPVIIEDATWVATRSTILPGINIGKYCVIAANSVVIKNVENYCVVGGNPARFIKKRILLDQ